MHGEVAFAPKESYENELTGENRKKKSVSVAAAMNAEYTMK